MGFLFVDRIEALDEHGARGQLDRPAGAAPPPHWLILEAVGQLAAWAAMARTGFASRPVAALIGEGALGAAPWCDGRDGPVELAARLERVDSRAVLYSGTATCGGREIARLTRCVGPLLPVELFDDPATLRQRLAALRQGGDAARGAGQVVVPVLESVATTTGGGRRATLQVPDQAPYFADHFPRRPVFPASLLAAALDTLAAPLAAESLHGAAARAVTVREYKVRAFSEPGQRLELGAELESVRDGCASLRLQAMVGGRRTASGWLDYRVAP